MEDNVLSSKSGQSVIEFCIGLVALLTVVSAVFQLGLMGLGRTEARTDATNSAALESLTDPDDTFRWIRTYVREVTDGSDNRAYSVDDAQNIIGSDEIYTQILEDNQSNILRVYAPDNDLARISGAEDMQAFTGLVRGTGLESDIPVMPIVRRLFFDQPSIDVEAEVWSVHLGGLY